MAVTRRASGGYRIRLTGRLVRRPVRHSRRRCAPAGPTGRSQPDPVIGAENGTSSGVGLPRISGHPRGTKQVLWKRTGKEAARPGSASPDRGPDRVAELETTVDGLRRQVSELEDALTNARVIGAAVGVLMAMRRLSYEEAWAALRVASQASNRKVRDVARTVVLTGELAVSETGCGPGRDVPVTSRGRGRRSSRHLGRRPSRRPSRLCGRHHRKTWTRPLTARRSGDRK